MSESAGYPITLVVNGTRRQLAVAPHHTLSQVLRDQLGLTGTKESCREGECGACTVLLDDRPVNSCLVLAPEADGHTVLTIEGLAHDGRLDPVQEAFIRTGSVQCGFCTPGMIMAAKGLLIANPHPSEDEIRAALAGNLCRCTGYHRIIQAVQEAAGAVGSARSGSQ